MATLPTGAIRSYADMIRELRQIEGASQGLVTVHTLADLGTAESLSEQGRDLYVAQVGEGDRHVWIMGKIHGDEPYGVDASLAVLKALGSSGEPAYRQLREEFTLHLIPMYNPDGAEMNTRTTTLWDHDADEPLTDDQGNPRTVDLNRDWTSEGFLARESRAWYEYWTDVQPSYALDIHHQGQKRDPETGEAITFSLGVSLAPGGPTLPGIRDGEYDVLTRQMASQVWRDTRTPRSSSRLRATLATATSVSGGAESSCSRTSSALSLGSPGSPAARPSRSPRRPGTRFPTRPWSSTSPTGEGSSLSTRGEPQMNSAGSRAYSAGSTAG